MATKIVKIEVDQRIKVCDYCLKEKVNQKCDCCNKDICKSHRGYKYPYDDNEEIRGIVCVECWQKFPKFAQEEIERVIAYLNHCSPEDTDKMFKPEFFMQKGFYVFSNAKESDSYRIEFYSELNEEDIREIDDGPNHDKDRYEYDIYDETGKSFDIDKSLRLV